MDAAFYMAKELLMTERTYKKDLQVIAVVCNLCMRFMNCMNNTTVMLCTMTIVITTVWLLEFYTDVMLAML